MASFVQEEAVKTEVDEEEEQLRQAGDEDEAEEDDTEETGQCHVRHGFCVSIRSDDDDTLLKPTVNMVHVKFTHSIFNISYLGSFMC